MAIDSDVHGRRAKDVMWRKVTIVYMACRERQATIKAARQERQ